MRPPLRTIVACGVLWVGQAVAGERVVQLGDYLVIHGKVQNCEDMGEFVVDIVRAEEEAENLFGHITPIAGRTADEVASSVGDAFEADFGRRPKTLRIEVLTESEYRTSKKELVQSMAYYPASIEACKRRLEQMRIEFRNLVESAPGAEPDRVAWRRQP